MSQIRIDEEFRDLIPPLTDDEKQGLEKSLLEEGCRDALIVWGDVLIDGHNRYEICTKHNIPFTTLSMEFESRDDVKIWMMQNQLARRNLITPLRLEIAEQLRNEIAKKAKANQGTRTDILVNCPKSINTRLEIAKLANTSDGTVKRYEAVKKNAPAPVVEATKKGDISINKAYEVTKMTEEQKKEIVERIEKGEAPKAVVNEVKNKPHVVNNSGNNEWYTPSKFIESARKVMGSIDTDPASCEVANKTVKATTFYSIEDDGLSKTWTGNVWMNPPYASGLVNKFIDKLVEERPNYSQAIVLVNNCTETSWFTSIASIASAVCFPRGRIQFVTPGGENKGAPLQGQAVVYVGNFPELFVHEFREIGWVARIV